MNQWKNTNEFIDWFINIDNKHQCTFIQLKIKDFYPSITEEILEKSLELAKHYIDNTEKDIRSIKQCTKSFLFLNDEPRKKKNTANCFDVTMGCLEEAEMCQLVGLYILSLLQKIGHKKDNGLYRDGGLVVLGKANGSTTDLCRNHSISIFKTIG